MSTSDFDPRCTHEDAPAPPAETLEDWRTFLRSAAAAYAEDRSEASAADLEHAARRFVELERVPPLSLEDAVAVLNRVGHNAHRHWQIWVGCSGREFRAIGHGPCGMGGNLTALEARAIAEYYLRHGIERWPGWEG